MTKHDGITRRSILPFFNVPTAEMRAIVGLGNARQRQRPGVDGGPSERYEHDDDGRIDGLRIRTVRQDPVQHSEQQRTHTHHQRYDASARDVPRPSIEPHTCARV